MVVVMLSIYVVLGAAYLLWQLFEASIQADLALQSELADDPSGGRWDLTAGRVRNEC